MPKKDDLEALSVDELHAENIRLGNLPEYQQPEIVARRVEINEVVSRKLAAVYAQLKEEEARGDRPPGQTITI